MKSNPIIRSIYLYIFTILGLVLMTIGGVRIMDMGLKAFVFTQADQEERLEYPFMEPPMKPILEQNINNEDAKSVTLTDAEEAQLKNWFAEYKNWQEKRSKINFVKPRRHRDAASSLSMILIGLPLYLYHWTIIKKETK